MSLVSLADMKTHLGIGDATYDTFLTEQLNLFSSAIENYCGRVFTETSYTQTFYKEDFDPEKVVTSIIAYHYPITTVTTITEYSPTAGTEITSTNYRAHLVSGTIYKIDDDGYKTTWLGDYDSNSYLTLEYDAGYATVPYEIQDVVKSLITDRYNKYVNGIQLDFGSDVQRVSIPGTISIDFDYTLQANERKSAFGMLIGNYANVLDYYRSERVLIGDIKEKYVTT